MPQTRVDNTTPIERGRLPGETLPAAGETIGRYTVVEKVGAGGMGVVYRARDPHLHREVAIKLVRPARLRGQGGAQHRARLLREARAMAQLQHPNVIRVYDVGEHGDALFIAMEFVLGCNAAQWTQRECPPWTRTLGVYRAAGRGLAAAHGAGLVHRDFKPANILVGDDQRVRVLDFGLARTVQEARGTADGEAATPDTNWCDAVTSDGVVVGTPMYMAPEQLAGLPADARSDQYSFCLSLWEGLFGSPPFRGRDARALGFAKAHDELVEPPGDTDVPDALIVVLTKGLSARPERRFGTMPDLLRTLRSIADAPAGASTAAASTSPRRVALWSLAFGAALALAAALWVGHDERACEADRDADALRDAFRRSQPSEAQLIARQLAEHWRARGCAALAREWTALAK